MAIRIKTNDATVEVDTISEFSQVFSQVIQALKGLDKQKTIPQIIKGKETKKTKKGSKLVFPQRDYVAFYRHLGDSNHSRILRILREKPDEGVTDETLRTRLGFTNNLQLAGTMAALSKRAIKFGFTIAEIIHKEQIVSTRGVRAYRYKLTKEMLSVVPGVLV